MWLLVMEQYDVVSFESAPGLQASMNVWVETA